VDYLKQFIIPYSGLALGNHQYEFTIGDAFFESIDYSEIQHGQLQVIINLEKQERMLVFDFEIDGIVNVECDRCLDDLEIEVQDNEKLIVKFGEDYSEESEDVITVPHNEHQFDVSHYIYEYISLSLPYQRIHPDDEDGNSTCDPDILERLKSLQPEQPNDPIWDKLKDINPDEN
jgi:uncharacterized metal-binding protein YceD (DUF177 family)